MPKMLGLIGRLLGRNFRMTQEYTGPTRLTKEDASRKVHQILVERLGLTNESLFLHQEPVCAVAGDLSQTNNLRRYIFHWQPPETPEQRDQRRIDRMPPAATVSAEVDAVSGDIKAINFLDKSFERPDPKIMIENEASSKKP
jgi:hypothetical protein